MTMTTALAAPPPSEPTRIAIRSPADLIAAIPFLLGFHPADSLLVTAFLGTRLQFAARGDLPGPDDPAEAIVDSLLDIAVRQRAETVAIVGYGPPATIAPLLGRLREQADRRGLAVRDVLEVHDGRWRSLLCDDPGCCPTDGTPVDVAATEVAAQLAFAGLSAAPDRASRAREVAQVGGVAQGAMAAATERAHQRLADHLADRPEAEWTAWIVAQGTTAVEAALDRYAIGGRLDDDELAWLAVLLDAAPAGAVAWQSLAATESHQRLWTDATQRVEPALAAPPASLLAFVAWQIGDGILARLALERALLTDPGYPMAQLLVVGLREGTPPLAYLATDYT